MDNIKTLATCKPSEFLIQTNKIRKSVSKWLTDTDIPNIRRNLPELTKITENMTDKEKKKVFDENRTKTAAQAKENLEKIFDAALEKYPQETLEVLALCCFVDPEKADDYPVGMYLTAVAELIGNQDVINFFISLVRLGESGILNTARK